ncbi:hypothetical protein BY457_10210 [Marinilabilia salmonicolor]|jgi:hypothetical protein|nr:hypothetical protein BY457_10210 [Marinilabilia salmonicolor]
MLQNFALQKEKMKAKYLKYHFSNVLLVVIIEYEGLIRVRQ